MTYTVRVEMDFILIKTVIENSGIHMSVDSKAQKKFLLSLTSSLRFKLHVALIFQNWRFPIQLPEADYEKCYAKLDVSPKNKNCGNCRLTFWKQHRREFTFGRIRGLLKKMNSFIDIFRCFWPQINIRFLCRPHLGERLSIT